MGAWTHQTVAEIREDGDDLGIMFDDRTWCWIPRPETLPCIGDRISRQEAYPGGFTVRAVIGEREVETFYAREMARRRSAAGGHDGDK